MQIRQGLLDRPGLRGGWRPLVLRCLGRHPRGRPTAEELVRILVGSGARPPKPGWYRATAATAATGDAASAGSGSWLSRRRVLAIGGVLGGGGVAGGGAGGGFGGAAPRPGARGGPPPPRPALGG